MFLLMGIASRMLVISKLYFDTIKLADGYTNNLHTTQNSRTKEREYCAVS